MSSEDVQKLLAIVARWDRVIDEDSFSSAFAELRELLGFEHAAVLDSLRDREFETDSCGEFRPCGTDGFAPELRSRLRMICADTDVKLVMARGQVFVITAPLRASNGVVGALWLASPRYSDGLSELVAACTPFIAAMLGRIAALEKVDKATKRKDTFLRLLGHDLRSPLSTMYGAIEAMKYGERPPRGLAVVERQLGYMTRLAEGLLETAQISLGKVTLDLKPTDLPLLIDVGLERAASELNGRGHSVAVDVPVASVFVLADLDRMANVVHKLVCYVSRRSGPDETISVAVVRDKERAILRVSKKPKSRLRGLADGSGAWLPLERARAVEPFDSELRIAQHMVELHSGTLETTVDGGHTEIVVTMPRTRLSTGAHAIVPSHVHAVAPASRILLVEDDVDLAETLGAALSARGHTVEIVHDGETALEVLTRFDADVVLVNIGLPGMDGCELATAIRARDSLRTPRLIAVTGFGSPDDVVRSLAAGFDEHLVKPIDDQTITNALARVDR
ncbi:MAG: response regulator [Deltaproteobacteria bacterium]